MEEDTSCKHCHLPVILLTSEGLQCCECLKYVHSACLIKGTVPGGLIGDVFYQFTCETCSACGSEVFTREKMPWFQAITLTLHHLSVKSPALARRGFFHWKTHIAAFIDKYWETLFPRETKRKKKWMGTISGVLSSYSPYFFVSGTSIFKDQGWWTLAMPKLTPAAVVQISSEFVLAKQKTKEQKLLCDEPTILQKIFDSKPYPRDVFNTISLLELASQSSIEQNAESQIHSQNYVQVKKVAKKKGGKKDTKKRLLPTLDNFQDSSNKKLFKGFTTFTPVLESDVVYQPVVECPSTEMDSTSSNSQDTNYSTIKPKTTEMDPLCHYNTSLRDISSLDSMNLKIKLLGGVRDELICSPYSGLFLKPYIRRDVTTVPPWLNLLAEIKLKANENDQNYVLPPRSCLDYVYVQPQHIPAINSLCNQFFWMGIDMTDILQYPDFSCVVMYRKLIVGFAFMVPDVKFNESYISFVFTRPGWRNVGIAKFMLYHLIQTCAGKDITLHVSTNNKALLLYQKLGFKVERVVIGFYDKYIRSDTKDSKDAFLCRLER